MNQPVIARRGSPAHGLTSDTLCDCGTLNIDRLFQRGIRVSPTPPLASWNCSSPPQSGCPFLLRRSEDHTSELQSLMRISSAVFCLKKKKPPQRITRLQRYNIEQ